MNEAATHYGLPPDKQKSLGRAKRLEWWTLAFMLSIIIAIGLTMGSSQTMKAMWVEDLLSLVPSAAFLVGAHYRFKAANERFPYGYRRAVLVAFLCGAVALFGFGVYILGDSTLKLVMAERPSIQTIELFGRRVWLGWPMIVVLLYSVIPPMVLGRLKQPLARELHDKGLYTSSTLNKGDWLSGIAGIAGLLGIAFGLWWADAAAALLISVEIVKDGWENLANSILQLMNKRPTDVETKTNDGLGDKLKEALERLDWIERARIRLREDGDILTGEVFVVPRDESGLLDRLAQANEVVRSVDWRVEDIHVVPVRSFEHGQDGRPVVGSTA